MNYLVPPTLLAVLAGTGALFAQAPETPVQAPGPAPERTAPIRTKKPASQTRTLEEKRRTDEARKNSSSATISALGEDLARVVQDGLNRAYNIRDGLVTTDTFPLRILLGYGESEGDAIANSLARPQDRGSSFCPNTPAQIEEANPLGVAMMVTPAKELCLTFVDAVYVKSGAVTLLSPTTFSINGHKLAFTGAQLEKGKGATRFVDGSRVTWDDVPLVFDGGTWHVAPTSLTIFHNDIRVPAPEGLSPVPASARFRLEMGGAFSTLQGFVPASALSTLDANQSRSLSRWALVGALKGLDNSAISGDQYKKLIDIMVEQPMDYVNRSELLRSLRETDEGTSPLRNKPLLTGCRFPTHKDVVSFFYVGEGVRAVNERFGAFLCGRNVARVNFRVIVCDICAVPEGDEVVEWIEAASREWVTRIFEGNPVDEPWTRLPNKFRRDLATPASDTGSFYEVIPMYVQPTDNTPLVTYIWERDGRFFNSTADAVREGLPPGLGDTQRELISRYVGKHRVAMVVAWDRLTGRPDFFSVSEYKLDKAYDAVLKMHYEGFMGSRVLPFRLQILGLEEGDKVRVYLRLLFETLEAVEGTDSVNTAQMTDLIAAIPGAYTSSFHLADLTGKR